MEEGMEEGTQSDRSYTTSYGRSVAATERTMAATECTMVAMEE